MRHWRHLKLLQKGHWTVLGKGPTFDLYTPSTNFTIGLNDVVSKVPVTIAHFIDYEAFERMIPYLDNCSYVVMPMNPHINCRPSKKSLFGLGKECEAIEDLSVSGRLFYYRKASVPPTIHLSHKIYCRYFSAEAAFQLIAKSGHTKIESYGVDGGDSYSSVFDNTHLLSNGRENFDIQTCQIEQTCSLFGVTWCRPQVNRTCTT